jgi:hypothetical protein
VANETFYDTNRTVGVIETITGAGQGGEQGSRDQAAASQATPDQATLDQGASGQGGAQ